MAMPVYSSFGLFCVWAAFHFAEHEAQHWVRYPSDKPEGARVFECDSEDHAFQLSTILGK